MKSIFESKVFWANALTVLIVLAGAFGITPNQVLMHNLGALLLTISPVINIVLRFFTSQPVNITGTPTE